MGEGRGAFHLYGLVSAIGVQGRGLGQFSKNKEGRTLVLGIRVGYRQNPEVLLYNTLSS